MTRVEARRTRGPGEGLEEPAGLVQVTSQTRLGMREPPAALNLIREVLRVKLENSKRFWQLGRPQGSGVPAVPPQDWDRAGPCHPRVLSRVGRGSVEVGRSRHPGY